MKKLLIMVLIIALINLSITIILLNKSGVVSSFQLINGLPDTVVNKVRIDSVELSIKRLDSTIINYNAYEKKLLMMFSILMIVQLLINSTSLFAHPLRGVETRDSVRIAIDDLRTANIIMTKAKIDAAVIVLKDSIINLKDKKIDILNNSYEEMKRYASASETARQNLERNLNKSKKKTKIIGGVAGAFASAFLVLLLIK